MQFRHGFVVILVAATFFTGCRSRRQIATTDVISRPPAMAPIFTPGSSQRNKSDSEQPNASSTPDSKAPNSRGAEPTPPSRNSHPSPHVPPEPPTRSANGQSESNPSSSLANQSLGAPKSNDQKLTCLTCQQKHKTLIDGRCLNCRQAELAGKAQTQDADSTSSDFVPRSSTQLNSKPVANRNSQPQSNKLAESDEQTILRSLVPANQNSNQFESPIDDLLTKSDRNKSVETKSKRQQEIELNSTGSVDSEPITKTTEPNEQKAIAEDAAGSTMKPVKTGISSGAAFLPTPKSKPFTSSGLSTDAVRSPSDKAPRRQPAPQDEIQWGPPTSASPKSATPKNPKVPWDRNQPGATPNPVQKPVVLHARPSKYYHQIQNWKQEQQQLSQVSDGNISTRKKRAVPVSQASAIKNGGDQVDAIQPRFQFKPLPKWRADDAVANGFESTGKESFRPLEGAIPAKSDADTEADPQIQPSGTEQQKAPDETLPPDASKGQNIAPKPLLLKAATIPKADTTAPYGGQNSKAQIHIKRAND